MFLADSVYHNIPIISTNIQLFLCFVSQIDRSSLLPKKKKKNFDRCRGNVLHR